MISVLCETPIIESNVDHYFSLNNLENVDLLKTKNISDYLRLDYDNNQYLHEAILATPNFTESRKKIMENNRILAVDRLANEHLNAATLTTKQDRNPNSGIIKFEKEVIKIGSQYRNLTPRECFLLMGFKENDFDTIIENDLEVLSGKKFLSNARLYKLTGNSIVVPVLEEIFKQINQINTEILKPTVSILQ